jgi:CHASE1-domain containing sensor protein
MLKMRKSYGLWILVWIAVSLLGCVWVAQNEIEQQRNAFETDARIVHRLLSQRAVQHDAIMSTLALLQSSADASRPEQRLSSVYPQILAVRRRDAGQQWEEPQFTKADEQSRAVKRPVLTDADFTHGRYWMVFSAETSYAMQIAMPGALMVGLIPGLVVGFIQLPLSVGLVAYLFRGLRPPEEAPGLDTATSEALTGAP